jgi:hypothetical protein
LIFRTIIFTFCIFFFLGKSNGQTNKIKDSVYTFCEVMPEFPGGKGKLVQYISSETYLPVNCSKENIEAKINVSFIIDTIGFVQEVVFNDKIACLEFETVIKKIFYFMPKWEAGSQNGKKVNVKMSFPIYINLE